MTHNIEIMKVYRSMVSGSPAFKIFDGRDFGNFRFFVCLIFHMHIERYHMFRFQMAVKVSRIYNIQDWKLNCG